LKDVPEDVRKMNPQAAIEAIYVSEDSKRVRVRLFAMPSETIAFALMQQYLRREQIPFYKGSKFLLLDSSELNKEQVSKFASEFAETLR
jgi:hypothetical protein